MSLIAAGLVASIAATGLKVAGGLQKAKSEASALRFNANTAREDAAIEETHTAAEINRARLENYLRTGSNRANAAASGAGLTGSTKDVLNSNAEQEELDILNIKHQGALKQRSLLISSALDISASKNVTKQAKLGAASTILKSGPGIAERVNSFLK